MQRRLVEELHDLEIAIQFIKVFHEKNEEKWSNNDIKGKTIKNILSIEPFLITIRSILDKLLSAPDKSFEVKFKGIDYNFIYPTTSQEQLEVGQLRWDLITEILSECIIDMGMGFDSWWMVTAFASGVDTLDMQIEIIGKEEHLNLKDAEGKRITALPLDLDNYQIEMQKPEVEFENDTATEEVDTI